MASGTTTGRGPPEAAAAQAEPTSDSPPRRRSSRRSPRTRGRRRPPPAHRDGAKVFSGTYLNDTGVLHRQEAGLARMVAAGFALRDVVPAFALVYSFTIGFCIEEQAVSQAVAAGDERYTLAAREERLSDGAHPLVVESGPALFSDPDARFADLVAVLVDAADRMRGPAPR